MYFALIVILSVVTPVWRVSCQDISYEYSEQRPWAFVYTLHPFFNSETLFKVWKGDNKDVDISANVLTLLPNDQGGTVYYSDRTTPRNETNPDARNNEEYANDSQYVTASQETQNRQKLLNYRNRHKNSNAQNE